jgi:bifunctional enzyme CysN/CysC/sulfate adenylyltransferase subunit 1
MLAAHETGPREGFESFLENDLRKDLLRFTTAGSVDDGKSTLIGRLLHDSKAVYEDQLAAVRKSRINRSGNAVDFSLLTDGLRAEREQGITIDVAYRYFSTPRRKFIIADTPGHEQYTRNMATGASTADLAIVLVDATKGLLPQTRRHAYIASLLGIPNVVAAINKMDLAGYREDAFLNVEREFLELARSLRVPHARCIPISALEGDNVVARSANMPWYAGPTLMSFLETVEVRRPQTASAFRFPIQWVIRPDATFRGFAGRVAGGVVRPGDVVLALPSRRRATVQAIVSYSGELQSAASPQSVVLQLADEIDLSRGDMLVSAEDPPRASNRFAAMLVWLEAQPLGRGRTYLLKHAGRVVKGKAREILFRVDVNDLTHHPAESLEMNGIAAVKFETNSPLFFDPYRHNRAMGSFILVDPLSNATVGAGMILEEISPDAAAHAALPVSSEQRISHAVSPDERSKRHGHLPGLFFVDRSAAERVERALFEKNFEAVHLRGERVPSGALPAVLAALWSSGMLVVYSGEGTSLEERAICESSRRFFFDLSVPSSGTAQGAHQDVVRTALDLAELLRVKSDSEDPDHQE